MVTIGVIVSAILLGINAGYLGAYPVAEITNLYFDTQSGIANTPSGVCCIIGNVGGTVSVVVNGFGKFSVSYVSVTLDGQRMYLCMSGCVWKVQILKGPEQLPNTLQLAVLGNLTIPAFASHLLLVVEGEWAAFGTPSVPVTISAAATVEWSCVNPQNC